jgi:hypothetical protein
MVKYDKIIITKDGEAKIESISISELGRVQLKLYYINDGVYKTISFDNIENILEKINLKIK